MRNTVEPQNPPMPLHGELVGSDIACAEGIRVKSYAPALALCRVLVAAGHDPERPLHLFRGDVLALVVASLRQGAQLRVATHGVGFERLKKCTTASPKRFAPPARATSPSTQAVTGEP